MELVVKKESNYFEKKIDRLQTENKRLVEEFPNYLKIVKLLSVGNQIKVAENNKCIWH